MGKLSFNPDRLPMFVGAGVIKHEQSALHLIDEEALTAQVLGSYTDLEWHGNSDGGRLNVFHWDELNQAAYNSIGLENPGRVNASNYLPRVTRAMREAGQFAMISVTTLKGEDPKIVIPIMTEWALEMGADGVEINGSCPNQDPEHPLLCMDIEETGAMGEAVRERVGVDPVVGFKVSPLGRLHVAQQAESNNYFDFFTVNNTKGNQPSPINGETGLPTIEVNDGLAGQSGPIIKSLSRESLAWWTDSMKGAGRKADILSIGGIGGSEAGWDVYERVHCLGAVAAGGAQEFYRARDPREVAQRWAASYFDAQASELTAESQ